jgi:hypothetical protein
MVSRAAKSFGIAKKLLKLTLSRAAKSGIANRATQIGGRPRRDGIANKAIQIDGQPRSEIFWNCKQSHSDCAPNFFGIVNKGTQIDGQPAAKMFGIANKLTQICGQPYSEKFWNCKRSH